MGRDQGSGLRTQGSQGASKITFITGTDTGVGKTLVTASLLLHLRSRGIHALAMKPFCSGSREDVRLLQVVQEHDISDDEMNPFYFREPLAPLVAARCAKRKGITLNRVLHCIRQVASKCEHLLVEGAGGLLAPLGEKFDARDLIAALRCAVCIVAANKLGTINHTLLTARALPSSAKLLTNIVLSQTNRAGDLSSSTNVRVLADLLAPVPVVALPYLGPRASTLQSVRRQSYALAPIIDLLTDQDKKKAPDPKRSGALTRQVN